MVILWKYWDKGWNHPVSVDSEAERRLKDLSKMMIPALEVVRFENEDVIATSRGFRNSGSGSGTPLTFTLLYRASNSATPSIEGSRSFGGTESKDLTRYLYNWAGFTSGTVRLDFDDGNSPKNVSIYLDGNKTVDGDYYYDPNRTGNGIDFVKQQ